jgi:hypothetical protein
MDFKYIILAIIAGALCKLYDDLNDNNLYEYFEIKQKEYINEFLKGLHYIFYTILSLNYEWYYIFYTTTLTIGCLYDPSAYSNYYEFSGLISVYFISLFINYQNIINFNFYDILFFLIYLIGGKIEFTSMQIEYSKSKLFIRLLSIIFFICILVFNNMYKLFSNNIDCFLYYTIGYLLVSCIFQVFLLNKDKDVKKEDVKKDDIKDNDVKDNDVKEDIKEEDNNCIILPKD